jgi:hypothetical protein
MRQTIGLPPTFALGATFIAPHDLVKSFEVLSLATLTSGLPNPEITSAFSDSILIRVFFVIHHTYGKHPYNLLSFQDGQVRCQIVHVTYDFVVHVWDLSVWVCTWSKMVFRLHIVPCGCFKHHFLTIDRVPDLKCDNAVIIRTAHCFFSPLNSGYERVEILPCLARYSTRGISTGGEYDELGGASGAKGGGTGLVATIGVSFLSWGVGSSPMKS